MNPVTASTAVDGEHAYEQTMTILQEMKNNLNISDQAILDKLKHFSEVYDDHAWIGDQRQHEITVYENSYHCAYLYRYFTAIALATKHYLNEYFISSTEQERQSVFFRGNTTMACIGGGPGTEIIGMLLFLQENNFWLKLNTTIFDIDDWSLTHANIPNGFGFNQTNATIQHYPFNFFDTAQDLNMPNQLREADIVSIVKFLSVVGHDERWQADDRNGMYRLRRLLRSLKPGVRVFFMDNSGGGYHPKFEHAALQEGLTLAQKWEHEEIQIGIPTHLIECFQIGTQQPQQNLKVTVSIWKK